MCNIQKLVRLLPVLEAASQLPSPAAATVFNSVMSCRVNAYVRIQTETHTHIYMYMYMIFQKHTMYLLCLGFFITFVLFLMKSFKLKRKLE